MITLGIDIGSIASKSAIIKDNKLIAVKLLPTGYNAKNAGENIFKDILAENNIKPSAIDRIAATGYGRKSVLFAEDNITEISCHAFGACFLEPDTKFIIDIGGQDSKAILINEQGGVKDFVMNDKCAAGTGRFLEVMARALEVDLENFGALSGFAEEAEKISGICTVFAESEVISLIAGGKKRENIIAGIHKSISLRIVSMASRLRITPPIMMTGGVAKNSGMVDAIGNIIKHKIIVSDKAQFTGAIGAAIIGAQKL